MVIWNKAISILCACAMFIESILIWSPPVKNDINLVPVTPIIETVLEETNIEEPVEEIMEEPIPEISNESGLTESEIDLIALVTMAEAEGECEEGKRLVIDIILNRVDSPRFPDTVNGVIYAKNAFECMVNGRVNRCYVQDDIRQLVIEEATDRSYSNIHYFRSGHYHGFGTPVVHVGNHYFSTY